MPPQDDPSTPVAAAPGNSNALAMTGPFTTAKILSLKIRGEHGALLGREDDLTSGGRRYPDPLFSYGKRAGRASLQLGSKIQVDVELELWPYEAGKAQRKLIGRAWGLTFLGDYEVAGGKQTVMLESTDATPKAVSALAGDFEVEVAGADGSSLQAEHAWGFRVYDTIGTPRDMAPHPEAGITTARMEAAVDWVGASGSLDSHEIVKALLKRFPGYVLNQANPKDVPLTVNHPSYDNPIGGAWHLYTYAAFGGECQAIARLVVAMIATLGVQGNGKVVVVWAEPNPSGGPPIVKEAEFPNEGLHGYPSRWVNGEQQSLALMDVHVEVGKVYQVAHAKEPAWCGVNSYEACVKIEQGGLTLYYGGGMSGAAYTGPDQVILVFFSLAWYASSSAENKIVIREVVHRWLDAAGRVLP
jgi:hypothetical protein